VFIRRYNEVSIDCVSTFEHTIVGFVRQVMKMRLGFDDDCDLGNRLKERGDLILLPAKLLPQLFAPSL
jgi:hypothetical protein